MQNSNIDELGQLLSDCFKPPKVYSVSEWADEFRTLSSMTSAEPGRWRTSRTPYLKEIMDNLSAHSPVQEIIFMKGTQVGGTESGLNWLGYIVDHAPAPTMLVLPTVDLAKRNSKQRIQPMIDENERLASKISAGSNNDEGNTILEKIFPGGILVMTGANSAVGLRSTPARNLFLDEYDAYPGDADGEGDPVKLVHKRSNTFSKRKWFKCSTPGIEGQSRVAKDYARTSQKKFFVPCPHCEFFQELVWKNVHWPEGFPEKAVYSCENCHKSIENWQKTTMLKAGYWKDTKPENINPKVVGYHLNALYSPVGWLSWGDIATEFVQAMKDGQESLKAFVNTNLAETWKEKAERPDWERLYERRSTYPIGKVPKGALFLTAGADVQKDRIEVEVVGWGRKKVSWSIDYRVFLGDTSQPAVWLELEKLLGEYFPTEENDKIVLPIKMLCVDSGYNTQEVYSWCRKFSQTKVLPIKGENRLGILFSRPKSVDVQVNGKNLRRGLKVWGVGVSMIKDELYGWLRQPGVSDDGQTLPGFCFFPQYEQEYFKQLTAEQLVTKVIKGRNHYEWEKIRERNEALDCRVYNRAAAAICGIDRFTEEKWLSLESQFIVQKGNNPLPEIKIKEEPQITIERRKSKWL